VGDLVADNQAADEQTQPQRAESLESTPTADKGDKTETSSESAEEVIATDDECASDANKITKVKVLTEADLASYTIQVSYPFIKEIHQALTESLTLLQQGCCFTSPWL